MLRESHPVSLRCGQRLLDLSVPVVMGILNVTPDSFYGPSRVGEDLQAAVDLAGRMLGEGASILDIGGMSSRPGAAEVTPAEEAARVLPVLEAVHRAFPEVIISVDTFRAEVARQAIASGAGMINDISGGMRDAGMPEVLRDGQAAYVIMHMRGTPETMQSMTDYTDLMGEILRFFTERLRYLRAQGVWDVVVDPGFGFAKTPAQNYQLVNRLHLFRFLDCPVMLGVSRKSTLSRTIGRPVEETLHATTALHMAALLQGASILRVHDVQAASDAIAVYKHLRQEDLPSQDGDLQH